VGRKDHDFRRWGFGGEGRTSGKGRLVGGEVKLKKKKGQGEPGGYSRGKSERGKEHSPYQGQRWVQERGVGKLVRTVCEKGPKRGLGGNWEEFRSNGSSGRRAKTSPKGFR